ncbi:hypothetical protein J6590_038340 [Homalodisca vitripennis]|nr:hypothetical protein J6590_038340 [Homalodisca vitripennis]
MRSVCAVLATPLRACAVPRIASCHTQTCWFVSIRHGAKSLYNGETKTPFSSGVHMYTRNSADHKADRLRTISVSRRSSIGDTPTYYHFDPFTGRAGSEPAISRSDLHNQLEQLASRLRGWVAGWPFGARVTKHQLLHKPSASFTNVPIRT